MGYFYKKCAVVTGAASGLGLGIAKRFLSLGGEAVWMADYNEKLLKREAERLETAYPGKVFARRIDVTDKGQVYDLVDNVLRENGRIDFLFNNAGRPMTRPTESISAEDFAGLVQLNLMGTVYGTLAVLKAMRRQNNGHIVNTASFGGLVPVPFQAAYCATKAAVISLTRSLAYEYASSGIFFSQFSPSNVATPIFAVEQSERMRKEGRTEAEIQKAAEEIRPPSNAMPINEALDVLFQGIERKKIDIICGSDAEVIYRIFCMLQLFLYMKNRAP